MIRLEPLVPTRVPRACANRFFGKDQVVWTLYNRSGREFNGNGLGLAHVAGATMDNGEVTAVAQRTPSWSPGPK